ncbi:unnamed protein product, partial [Cuscuta epithymum]
MELDVHHESVERNEEAIEEVKAHIGASEVFSVEPDKDAVDLTGHMPTAQLSVNDE